LTITFLNITDNESLKNNTKQLKEKQFSDEKSNHESASALKNQPNNTLTPPMDIIEKRKIEKDENNYNFSKNINSKNFQNLLTTSNDNYVNNAVNPKNEAEITELYPELAETLPSTDLKPDSFANDSNSSIEKVKDEVEKLSNKSEEKTKKIPYPIHQKFGIRIAISPDGYKLKDKLSSYGYNFTDKNESSISFGADMYYHLKKAFQLSVGFYYVNKKYGIFYNNQPTVPPLKAISSDLNLQYLDIPFRGIWNYFTYDNFNLSISFGFVTGIYLTSNQATQFDDGKYYSNPFNEFSKLRFSAQGSLAISYMFNKKIGIEIEPLLRFSFSDGILMGPSGKYDLLEQKKNFTNFFVGFKYNF